MCHAVFTHISGEQIMACLERLEKVMAKGRPLVFTYNLSRRDRVVHRGRCYAEQLPLISVHLANDGVFRDFCSARGLVYEPFDAVPHPGQCCGVITY